MEVKAKNYIRDCFPTDQWIEQGFKAGIKTVVDWLESTCGEKLEGYVYINQEIWQAKLKEWGEK